MTRQRRRRRETTELLVVANVGDQADYTTEVRHRVSVALPFLPNIRSSTRQLRQVRKEVQRQLPEYLPAWQDFHVWLIDEKTGEPGLFITGLLAVREGRSTKANVEKLNAQLLPQVTCDQPLATHRLLVMAIGNAWGEPYDEEFGEAESPEDREYELLGSVFGVLDNYELVDVDHSECGLCITGEAWHTFSLELPFEPSKDCTAPQLRQIHMMIEEAFYQECCGGLYDLEPVQVEVWLLDESNAPGLPLTGLLNIREGADSLQQFERSWKFLASAPPGVNAKARAA